MTVYCISTAWVSTTWGVVPLRVKEVSCILTHLSFNWDFLFCKQMGLDVRCHTVLSSLSLELWNSLSDISHHWIFRSRCDFVSLLILHFFWGRLLLAWSKSLRPRRFKLDRDEIWQQCSSSNESIDGVIFLIWRQNFQLVIMGSFMQRSAATWWVNTKRLTGAYAAAYASSWSVVHLHLFSAFGNVLATNFIAIF